MYITFKDECTREKINIHYFMKLFKFKNINTRLLNNECLSLKRVFKEKVKEKILILFISEELFKRIHLFL